MRSATRDRGYCECCGAHLVDHKHTLNTMLVGILRRMSELADGEVGRSVHPRDAISDHSRRSNLQKLRYFGLLEKSFREDGSRIRGEWTLTQKGSQFVRGVGYCFPAVWTFRGDVIEFEGEPVEIGDVVDTHVREHDDYAADARPHYPEDEEDDDDWP